MGNAFFLYEACEADAAVNTLTFLAENTNTPHFRFKHVATSTVEQTDFFSFCFYSRRVFMQVFTALQVILALFTLYLFNYLGTLRYYYAQHVDYVHINTNTPSFPLSKISALSLLEQEQESSGVVYRHKVLGLLYLSVVNAVIFFVLFLGVYVVILNSSWCVSRAMERFERQRQTYIQQRCFFSKSPHYAESIEHHGKEEQQSFDKNNSSRIACTGGRYIFCSRPYYRFFADHLLKFDYWHNLHLKLGDSFFRQDFKNVIFFLLSPFVLLLTIIDIITIDEMRTKSVQVSFLQGILLGFGILFLLYVITKLIVIAGISF